MLAPGGSLVYSTCALTEEENDAVVARLFAKYGDEASLDKPDFPDGEETRCGRIILPDVSGGKGPLYVARILKTRPPVQ
jgi:16S rRNA (cytosine1407-C5)-methyltransferase